MHVSNQMHAAGQMAHHEHIVQVLALNMLCMRFRATQVLANLLQTLQGSFILVNKHIYRCGKWGGESSGPQAAPDIRIGRGQRLRAPKIRRKLAN